jgi:hypothetical protein
VTAVRVLGGRDDDDNDVGTGVLDGSDAVQVTRCVAMADVGSSSQLGVGGQHPSFESLKSAPPI